jgi:long-chain acyl-CoA synthetase
VTVASIQQFLERSAARSPDHELLVQQAERWSYRQIDRAANHVAAELLERGLRKGDRVGLLARNSAFYVAAYFGILKAGGVVVALNTASDAAMLAGYLRMSGAIGLMVGTGMERLVRGANQPLGALEDLRWVAAPHADRLGVAGAEAWLWEPGERDPVDLAVSADDLATIVFTSGSTGRARGAMLSHGNVVSNVTAINAYLGLGPQDRVLQVLPFYYVYGKSVLNSHVMAGATVVIENRFRYPQVALDTLEQERCTGLSGVPSTFAILLDRTNFAERALADLRYVTQAGGAMSPTLTRRLMERLAGKSIFVMYGATEASARLAYLPPDELAEAVGSIGRAIDGVELRVLAKGGRECAVGEVGELVARGPNIMRGYWDDAEETARVLDDDGYHTGDLARRDGAGRLFIVGRKKHMVKVGGHRLSPLEIEDAIVEDPAVSECAVIGVEDERMGEQLAAFVVLVGEATAESIAAGLRKRVPAYKIPPTITIVTELPKNESGKVMKHELRLEAP